MSDEEKVVSIEEEMGINIPDPVEEIENDTKVIDTKGIFDKVLGMLFAETGEGSIDSYIENPLNFEGSRGMAQIIRGVNGALGSTNKAIFDIVIGFMRYKAEKRG